MGYAVKEIFHTLQGEGAQTGRAAVFCRFAGCNLWNGTEQGRATATCKFCDTDFVGTDGEGGGKFKDAMSLAEAVETFWIGGRDKRLVVCTGGEPLLQLDERLIEEFHKRDFRIAVETNGTVLPPSGIDWITVSPKAGAELLVKSGQELKLIYPQEIPPSEYQELDFENFFLQPMDGPNAKENMKATLEYCLKNPQWRLSLQTHKILGIR